MPNICQYCTIAAIFNGCRTRYRHCLDILMVIVILVALVKSRLVLYMYMLVEK